MSKKLEKLLISQSTALLKKHVAETKKWAEEYYNVLAERITWKDKQWCEFLGVTPVKKDGAYDFPDGFFGTDQSRKLKAYQVEIEDILKNGKAKFLEKQITSAKKHYVLSIERLAKKIISKDLNLDNIQIRTYDIDKNITTSITDGEKSFNAYTIVAGGKVQKPHYRYIIKSDT